MAENPRDEVTLVAYADLSDPVAGQVERGEEFTTEKRHADMYAKANWAGPPGTDPRDIQLEVAYEGFEEQKAARAASKDARQVFRNLVTSTAQKGHSAAVDVMPQQFLLPEGEVARTNAQEPMVEGGGPELVSQQSTDDVDTVSGSGDSGTSGGGSNDAGGGGSDYQSQRVPELKQEAQSRGLSGAGDANKAQLVEMLEEDDANKQANA